MLHRSLYFVCCISLLVLQGCPSPRTTTHIKKRKNHKEIVIKKPIKFLIVNGRVLHLEGVKPADLFAKGTNSYKANRYKEAQVYFSYIAVHHTKSRFHQPALYNLALSYGNLKKYQKAIDTYKTIIKQYPNTTDSENSLYRIGASYLALSKWPEAEKIFSIVVKLKDQDVPDKLEAMANYGLSLFNQKKYNLAEEAFRKAVRLYRKTSKEEFLGSDYFAAMSQHYVGRVYEARFRSRKFRPSKQGMAEDLEEKARNLLTAQAHYIRAIRIRNPQWIVAAIYRIALMYRQMYDDMLRAPIPKHLSKEEKDLYTQMLKKRIKILLKKASIAYEKNIQAAENLGLQDNKYIKKSKRDLQELKKFIVKTYLSEPKELPENTNTKDTPKTAPPKDRPSPMGKRPAPPTPKKK